MRDLVQDLRYGARMLVRSPGFTLAALAVLALGIGANSALYSLVDSILLHPLPGVREPASLVAVSSGVVSYPDYLDFREGNPALSGLAAHGSRVFALRMRDRTVLVSGDLVSGNYFEILGARPAQGRILLDSDDRPEAPPAAVVSHRFWRKELGGRSDAVGEVLELNGVPVEIAGVAEPGFRGTRLDAPDVWVPIALWPRIAPASFAGLDLSRRGWGWLSLEGRLAAGATLAQAQASMNETARRLAKLHPDSAGPESAITLAPAVVMAPGSPAIRGTILSFFGILIGVVGLVLLIACANVANLLLARAQGRRREIAVRRALGASATRIARQLLTESLLLSLLAGGFSLLVTLFVGDLLGRFTWPGGISAASLGSGPGGAVFLFALVMSLGAGLLFGLAPAWQGARVSLISDLKEAPREGGRGRGRVRTGLLVTQVTLSLVLLAGAGLFLRSLERALRLDLGFHPERVARVTVDVGLVRCDPPRAGRFYADALARVTALPGVRSASWISSVPLTSDQDVESARIEGYRPAEGEHPVLETNLIGPHFTETLGLELRSGRGLDERDAPGAPRAILINEAMARRYWPGKQAAGGRVEIHGETWSVAGVIQDFKVHDLTGDPAPAVYLSLYQSPGPAGLMPMTMIVRTEGDPRRSLEAIRREVSAAGPEVPVFQPGTLEDRLDVLLMPQRLAASLLGWLSLLALAIAAVGIYGVAAYEVSRRTREIGIRVAMGASPRDVLRMVLQSSLARLALGILLGVPPAALLGRAASAFLYGVGAIDPIAYAAAGSLLLGAGLLASYLPARRAARVDPVAALRYE